MKDAVPSSSIPSGSSPDKGREIPPYVEERILAVKIPTPEDRGKEVPLSGHDVHCLRIWRMYSLYVYDKDIDERILIRGLEALLKEVPSVGGVFNSRRQAVDITNIQVPLHIKNHAGTAVQAAEVVDTQGEDIFYTEIDVPSVVKGLDRLMKVQMNTFSGGGAIVGVTLSHGVADGYGMHRLIHRWAELCKEIGGGGPGLVLQAPVVSASVTGPTLKRSDGHSPSDPVTDNRDVLQAAKTGNRDHKELLKALAADNRLPPRIVSFRQFLVGGMIKKYVYNMAYTNLFKKRFRFKVTYTAEDVRKMKEVAAAQLGVPLGRESVASVPIAVTRETTVDVSGRRGLSTNEVISAQVVKVFTEFMGLDASPYLTIGIIYNARNRLPVFPPNYIGNLAYQVTSTGISKVGGGLALHRRTLGEVASMFKDQVTRITPSLCESEVATHEDCYRHGYFMPSFINEEAFLVTNNQSGFPTYETDFGLGPPVKHIPHNIGDNFLITRGEAPGSFNVFVSDLAKNPLTGAKSCRPLAEEPWISKFKVYE